MPRQLTGGPTGVRVARFLPFRQPRRFHLVNATRSPLRICHDDRRGRSGKQVQLLRGRLSCRGDAAPQSHLTTLSGGMLLPSRVQKSPDPSSFQNSYDLPRRRILFPSALWPRPPNLFYFFIFSSIIRVRTSRQQPYPISTSFASHGSSMMSLAREMEPLSSGCVMATHCTTLKPEARERETVDRQHGCAWRVGLSKDKALWSRPGGQRRCNPSALLSGLNFTDCASCCLIDTELSFLHFA